MPAPVVMKVASRGSMYSALARATWVLASRVRARSEKIWRTSCVRSKTCTFEGSVIPGWVASSARTLRCWPKVSSSSKTTASPSWRTSSSAISASLPLPTNVAPLARSRRWYVLPTTRSRAVSQRRASSPRESSTLQSAVALAASRTFPETRPPLERISANFALPLRDVSSRPTKYALGQLLELNAMATAAASEASRLDVTPQDPPVEEEEAFCSVRRSSSSRAAAAAAISAAAAADSAAATPRSRRRAWIPISSQGFTSARGFRCGRVSAAGSSFFAAAEVAAEVAAGAAECVLFFFLCCVFLSSAMASRASAAAKAAPLAPALGRFAGSTGGGGDSSGWRRREPRLMRRTSHLGVVGPTTRASPGHDHRATTRTSFFAAIAE
mmetsp:Transcript_36526/g.117103  ORF Transcript_36526/g.117103 Transcript_36526/m.117103 type:complete len:384 (+) Transcript_36526:1760-2911(+)